MNLSAEECFELTEENQERLIENALRSATLNGLLETRVNFVLIDSLMVELESLGFAVDVYGETTNISWDCTEEEVKTV